jgi:hypothetical protein
MYRESRVFRDKRGHRLLPAFCIYTDVPNCQAGCTPPAIACLMNRPKFRVAGSSLAINRRGYLMTGQFRGFQETFEFRGDMLDQLKALSEAVRRKQSRGYWVINNGRDPPVEKFLFGNGEQFDVFKRCSEHVVRIKYSYGSYEEESGACRVARMNFERTNRQCEEYCSQLDRIILQMKAAYVAGIGICIANVAALIIVLCF